MEHVPTMYCNNVISVHTECFFVNFLAAFVILSHVIAIKARKLVYRPIHGLFMDISSIIQLTLFLLVPAMF